LDGAGLPLDASLAEGPTFDFELLVD